MNLLRHPFRLRANGTVDTVAEGTDASDVQLITALVLTRPGERELFPGFGIADPVSRGLNPTELAAQVSQYGPDVTIVDVREGYSSDTTSQAVIEFQ